MKNVKITSLLLFITTSLFFSSCAKFSDYQSNSSNTETTHVKSLSDYSYCGDAITVNLVNSLGEIFGEVSIFNDEENYYVIYSVNSGYSIEKTHLYLGSNANLINNPLIEYFPYKTIHNPIVEEFTYRIPVTDFSSCFIVAAQAEIIFYDDNGLEFNESAWGEGEYIGEGSDGMKFEFCKQSCGTDIPITYQTESAWASGTRYNKKGNWATYSSYNGNTMSLPIYAGQTIDIGTATFVQNSNGTVTISIQFKNGWELQPVKESVKIQGYNNSPSGNPAPGKFKTYKGIETTVTVPQYLFYGIHLDVRKAN